MNRSRFGPRTLTALVGHHRHRRRRVRRHHRHHRTERDRRRQRRGARRDRHAAAVAVTPAADRCRRAGPNGGMVIRWFVGLGAGGTAAADRGRAKFVNDFNASQKDVYIVAGDLRQQRRREQAQDRRSRPATRRTSSGRSASRASTSSATTCSTWQPLIDVDRTTT